MRDRVSDHSIESLESPNTRPIRKNVRERLSGSTSKRDGGLLSRGVGISAHHHVYARVGIILGTAAVVFFICAVVGFWLVPALTSSAPEDVASARTSQAALTSNSAAKTSLPQRPDPDPIATAAPAGSSPPEQKLSVATLIPQRTPSRERLSDAQLEHLPNAFPPAETSLGWVASPESATTTPRLDLDQVEDAKRVQQRLIEHGFLFGAADGVWGSRSRKALQDFKIANGMGKDDTWDEETQEGLLTASDAIAGKTSDAGFVGGWGVDAAQCREAPLKITARRAEASGAACDFRSTQREALHVWRLRAQCASNGERWTANIRFTLSGRKLVWSSGRGTTRYVRC
jgi:hypothetical protein